MNSWNSLPQRTTELARRPHAPGALSTIAPGPGPGRRPWVRNVTTAEDGGDRDVATKRRPIRPVSKKRQRENRERAAMADRLWPDRREGTVMCGCGRDECHRPADDLHEPLSRARGGSITDEDNAIPLARECHDEITLGPDWAYRAGLLKHDGLCCQGRDVCSQYAEGGEAAA